MTQDLVVRASGLEKRYARRIALAGFDLTCARGEVTALLGPDGAGKSTALKALVGIVRPSSGEARVLDLDPARSVQSCEIRRRAAFISEGKEAYGDMTVGGLVAFTSSFFPQWRGDLAATNLARFGLEAGQRVRALPVGGRAKLALLLALARQPELLVLDEPAAGLDAASAEDLLQALIAYVAGTGASVVLASHQVEQVAQIADRVSIVQAGRVRLNGALDELHDRFRRIVLAVSGAVPAPVLRTPQVVRVRAAGDRLEVIVDGGEGALLAEAAALGAQALEVTPMTLREIFIESVHGGLT